MKDTPQCSRIGLALLALGAAIFHLAFGLYYGLRVDPSVRLSLQQSGDAYLANYPGWDSATEHDSAAYNRAAVTILEGGVPRSRSGALFVHAPVYAYFLAGCYAVGGVRVLAVAIPQALLFGLTVWWLSLAAEKMARWRPSLAAYLVALLMAINLRLAIYVPYPSPTLLLMMWVAWAFFLAVQGESPLTLAVVVGLACLTQAGFLFVGLLVALWLVWEFGRNKRRAFLVAAGVLVALAVGRLAVELLDVGGKGRGDELRESSRSILWEANNPYYESMGLFDSWERRPGNPWTKWKMSPDEKQRYEDYLQRTGGSGMQAGFLWIKENPGQYAKLCLIRLRTTLGPYTGQMSPRNRRISAVIWLLIFPAGFVTLIRNRSQAGNRFSMAVGLAVALSGTLVITEWYLRYRLPLELLLTAGAGVFYAACIHRWTPNDK